MIHGKGKFFFFFLLGGKGKFYSLVRRPSKHPYIHDLFKYIINKLHDY